MTRSTTGRKEAKGSRVSDPAEEQKPLIEMVELPPEVEERLRAEHIRDCPDGSCYGHNDSEGEQGE
jgi:hypothetical protein